MVPDENNANSRSSFPSLMPAERGWGSNALDRTSQQAAASSFPAGLPCAVHPTLSSDPVRLPVTESTGRDTRHLFCQGKWETSPQMKHGNGTWGVEAGSNVREGVV